MVKKGWANPPNPSAEFTTEVFDDYLTGGLTVQTTGPNPPDLVVIRDDIRLFGFAGIGATTEQAFFTVHIKHDIKIDDVPTFHVHWTHNNAAPSGDVKWNIDVSGAPGYSAGTFGTTTKLSSTQTAGVQYTHHITSDDDMALPAGIAADLEPDMQLICRIFRDPTDAADTFADDAMLIGVDMHYVKGQIATEDRNRPFTGF